MQKEPLSLYIFRFVMGIGLLVFMFMLYWSSLLIESDLKALRSELTQIKNELSTLKTFSFSPNASKASTSQTQRTSLADPSLPNLLTEDPFFTVTLPQMLGPDFQYEGTFQRVYLGKPNNLHPFTNWAQIAELQSFCIGSVARLHFGKYETRAPYLAIKMEERLNKKTGQPEFWIHLRDGVYWQPLRPSFFSEDIKLSPHFQTKHLVTAHDFKFYYDAIMNPHVQEPGAAAFRTYYDDVEAFEVIDDVTFIVRWKNHPFTDPEGKTINKIKYSATDLTTGLRPLASFVYQYFPDGHKIIEDDSDPETYRKNSVWAQNFNQHWAKNIIVSCGAWKFEGMTDRQITFSRNADHFFPFDALAEGIEVQFKDSVDAMWQQFKANQVDFYEMRPDQLVELETFMNSPQYKEQSSKPGSSIQHLEYLARQYAFIGWNQAKPYFQSKRVRQALTMAIDRQRIIRQILNGLGVEVNGTFAKNSMAYDNSIKPWPFDVQQAKRILEEEGWFDSDGDGILDKTIDGERVNFEFNLMYFVKGVTGKAIAEYVSTALKEIGILAHPQGVDIADLSAAFDNKNFDALTMLWGLGTPPEDPKQIWYSKNSAEAGSSNVIGFSNAEADRIIEDLIYETDPQKRIALYHRFDAILHDEAPYTFLYSPKILLAYRDRLQNVIIPSEHQELIPGANISEPDLNTVWLKK
ncbi:MAG: permease [Parachlamydiaceae bacterium]|nr:permease [Parachlamydiaceae bacterium]